MISPIQPIGQSTASVNVPKNSQPAASTSFVEELAQVSGAANAIRFSAHAQKRLADRSIALSEEDRARIAQSADLAAAKGAREALVLMDRLALVVGVPSRTVITVMEPQDGSPAVFTHIDSVVMAPRGGG